MSLRGCVLAFLFVNSNVFVSSDSVDSTGTDVGDSSVAKSSISGGVSGAPADSSAPLMLSLLSSFPEDLEISEYCVELLNIFALRYTDYVRCLVPVARPVRVCLRCFASYGRLADIYRNISSDQMGPANVSCRDSLLRSDRLMLVYLLYSNMEELWRKANCESCISDGYQNVTAETLQFMRNLNQTLSCFEKYQQGNHTELCKNCRSSYKGLNELYGKMELSKCIDVEDAMNTSRKLWSKSFNCSFSRDETVPVIAVSSFMLFLPVIFYLSSFLHSEQKKRKLIQPKRANTYTTLMNIQDKRS